MIEKYKIFHGAVNDVSESQKQVIELRPKTLEDVIVLNE